VDRSPSAAGRDEEAPRGRPSSRQRASEDGRRPSAACAAVREGSPKHGHNTQSSAATRGGQPPLKEAAVASK
jgi:hypothetical protein